MNRRSWLRPALYAAAAVLVVLVATGITLGISGGGGSSSGTIAAGSSPGGSSPGGSSPGGTGGPQASGGPQTSAGGHACERLAIPAYFSSVYWEMAIHAKHPPTDMILDISGVGAGTAPDKEFQYLVKQAQGAGVTVLGYSSTVNGDRPAAEVEADVRDYAAWYGVTSIFLDRVSGKPAQVPYYTELASYIHGAHAGAQVWLNPGDYPDQGYMSIGDVVMVFEGTYAQYLGTPVPGWARSYSAGRFAHTIYATPQAALADALAMAKQRNAGHLYVTDLVGANPYQGLPSYWTAEDAAVGAGCRGSG